MTEHHTGTRDEWLEARLGLLKAEKELTRLNDDLARQRRELPWVRIDKDYVFDTEDGEATLTDLFRGRSQLVVYHFMYGPDWDEGCPSCSAVADGFDETHCTSRTTTSRSPPCRVHRSTSCSRIATAWDGASRGRRRDGATSTSTSTSRSPRSRLRTAGRTTSGRSKAGSSIPRNCRSKVPGMSAFVLEDGVVYHTYSAYSRGVDALWNMWQWLDRTPVGRNEGDLSWFRRHDQYDASYR